MNPFFITIVFFVILLTGEGAVGKVILNWDHPDEPTGFENFLEQAFIDYPAWMIKNNYDPLPVVRDPSVYEFDFKGDFANITGKLWNDTFTGHGSSATFNITNVNLLRGTLNITVSVEAIEVIGAYEMSGNTVLSPIPISGSGTYYIHQLGESKASLDVFGFGMTADGYIDLSKATITTGQRIYIGINYFDGLEAGGFETDVKRLAFDLYDEAFDLSILSPMHVPMRIYLEEIFKNTKVDSIVKTPPPK